MDNDGESALSILIPTHNGKRWIAETLAGLEPAAGGLKIEPVIVDNASQDGTPQFCAEAPGVRFIANQTNGGFSRAINSGALASTGRTIVVLNQDLFLRPNSLRAVADFLADREAVIGGCLLSSDGRPQPSTGPFPSFASTVLRLPLPRRMRKYYLQHPIDRASVVEWTTGAFMAFPRSLFDAVGGFDEGFFMYYEDVDFCMRAHQKGYPVFYLPTAEAVHVAPFAERRDAPEWLRKEIRISQMRYFDKHRPRWEAATIRAFNRAYFAAHRWEWPPVSRTAAAQ